MALSKNTKIIHIEVPAEIFCEGDESIGRPAEHSSDFLLLYKRGPGRPKGSTRALPEVISEAKCSVLFTNCHLARYDGRTDAQRCAGVIAELLKCNPAQLQVIIERDVIGTSGRELYRLVRRLQKQIHTRARKHDLLRNLPSAA